MNICDSQINMGTSVECYNITDDRYLQELFQARKNSSKLIY